MSVTNPSWQVTQPVSGTFYQATQPISIAGTVSVEPATTRNIINIGFNESVAAPTAAVWYVRKLWALPAGAHATPIRAWAAVTTAASRTMIAIINSLGTWTFSPGTFAATNSVASPYHYSRLFGVVTTVMPATASTITPTYTDELGNSQNATAVAFASASPQGNAYEFPLAAGSLASSMDCGVRAVTAASDNANPASGVVTFYGVNPILDTVGPASVMEAISGVEFAELNVNEQIAIFEIQAATTAQQRSAGVTIALR